MNYPTRKQRETKAELIRMMDIGIRAPGTPHGFSTIITRDGQIKLSSYRLLLRTSGG